MKTNLAHTLIASAPEVRIFDLQLVDGHCITPFDIFYVTPPGKDSFVRALAFPGTSREYAVLIDRADRFDNLATGESSGTCWIDLELGAPTILSQGLGAAIESKCRERNNH